MGTRYFRLFINNCLKQQFLFAARVVLATQLIAAGVPALANATAADQKTADTLLNAIQQGKHMSSFRLRYEQVDQEGNSPTGQPLESAQGITLRSLIGWQTAPFQNFSFAAQLINVSKLQDDFNDSTNGTLINGASNQLDKIQFAKIVDPDYTGVNQLYIDWTGINNTRVRLGRQQVNLDNVRFIGDIAFRQVMQVFDGVSLLNRSLPDTEVFLANFNRVRQVSTVLRDNGVLNIANVKYRFTPTESLSGYAYLDGFKDLGLGAAWLNNASASQANKIFGIRLDGAHPLNQNWKILYTAEYAQQSNYQGSDSRIHAHYYKAGGGVGYGNLTVRLDQELLSSNNGQFAFQTPLGTNHLFQGWTDKFLVTPAQGMQDTFVTSTYKYGDFSFFADYHWYRSDESFTVAAGGTGNNYGREWNLAASWQYDKHLSGKVEYGSFKEGNQYVSTARRIRDTDKLWLTIMYSL